VDLSAVDEEGLGHGVGGRRDGIVTLTSPPLSTGKVTALVRLRSQLTILLQCFSAASLLQHTLGVSYSEHIRFTAVWRSYSLRGHLAKYS